MFRAPNLRWTKITVAAVTILSVFFLWLRVEPFKDRHRIHATAFDLTAHSVNADASGFMALQAAEDFCQAHRWRPYPKRNIRRKVYDLFLINGELDWIEIRLNELKDHVDYFVVVESATSFTNNPKPLHMKENWAQFEPFHKKIIYRELNNTGFSSDIPWDWEDRQRNALFDQVFPDLSGEQEPNAGDVILVSDVDEIPRPATLTVLRNCAFPRRLTLRSRFYYYGFQWLHRGEEWAHPQATIYQGLADTILPVNLRNGDGGLPILSHLDKADLWNAAWHCSSCFRTLEEMINKITSFSHQGWNRPEFRDRAGIVRRVRKGLDLFDREGQIYDRIDRNTDIPEYLKGVQERERFLYLLDRDGENAGFRDYTEGETQKENVGPGEFLSSGLNIDTPA
jgi:beta-1,4-mannosyl-glycoprotein beta-1,4-N-acetylglucosaminyltransferase